MRALVFTADGQAQLVTTAPDDTSRLDWLITQVGGFCDAIGGTDWSAYFHEDGKLIGLQLNREATKLALAAGWPPGDYLAGAVVFLGQGPAGEDTDVPARLLALAGVQGDTTT